MEKNLKPIGALFAESWRLYKKHMNVFALISVIPFLFAGVKLALGPYLYDFWGQPVSVAALAVLAVFGLLYVVFIIAMPLALTVAVHEAENGKKPDMEAVYKRAFSSIFPYLVILILTAIVVIGGSILFIIPGIIASIYLSLVMYVYIFEGKNSIDALVTSAWYVRNFWWDILARKLALAVLVLVAMAVFSVIIAPIVFILGFGAAVFQFLFSLFLFMIIVPFSLTVYYQVYKDVKHAQHARGRTGVPEKSFMIDTEKIFVILIVVAAVAAIGIFFLLSFQSMHQPFFHYGMNGTMRHYQFQQRY